MAKERSTPRYIKIAQDVCGKILTGEYPEGTLLKGRSILGAAYGVSPETVRKALNILEKEKVVSSKRGVGVFVDSVLHAVKFSSVEIPQNSWINGKTVGEVYFWNYTEATIVAVVGSDNITKQSVGPDFVLHAGDKLIFVGKDNLTYDRVLSFLTYGVINQGENA